MKLVLIDDEKLEAVKAIVPGVVEAAFMPLNEDAVIIVYAGQTITPSGFAKWAELIRKETAVIQDEMEARTGKKVTFFIAISEEHVKAAPPEHMARLGWFRALDAISKV